MQNVGSQGAWGQRLLSPILIELNSRVIIHYSLSLLNAMLELEPFGGSTLALPSTTILVSDWTTLMEDDDIALGGS